MIQVMTLDGERLERNTRVFWGGSKDALCVTGIKRENTTYGESFLVELVESCASWLPRALSKFREGRE